MNVEEVLEEVNRVLAINGQGDYQITSPHRYHDQDKIEFTVLDEGTENGMHVSTLASHTTEEAIDDLLKQVG